MFDIFTNFLPGAVLLFGLYLPTAPQDFSLPALTITGAAVLTVLAFVVGLVLQAIASSVSGKVDQPFDSKISDLESDADTVRGDFASVCRKKFGVDIDQLETGDDELGWQFKSILSDLENSPWSRTLRIQALHLAARGLAVAFLVLTVYYGAFWLGLFGVRPTELFTYPLAPPIGTAVAIVLLITTTWRARHLEEDVVVYMISEFTMENRDELEE